MAAQSDLATIADPPLVSNMSYFGKTTARNLDRDQSERRRCKCRRLPDPAGLVLYEITYLAATNRSGVATAFVGCIVNVIVCYLTDDQSQASESMPGIVSPFVAAVLALSLASDIPPRVAFIIGAVGPLVDADLLHLRDLEANAIPPRRASETRHCTEMI